MGDGEGLGGMERYYYPRHDVASYLSSMIAPILDVIHVVILVRIYV